MINKHIKFFSFLEDIEISEAMDQEREVVIKSCIFKDDVIATLQLENLTKIRLAVKRMEFDTEYGYCSFYTSELEGPVFQLFLGSDGFITIDQAEDHILLIYEKYGMDVLSCNKLDTDYSEIYPLIKFDAVETSVDGNPFVYGDVGLRLSAADSWISMGRYQAPNMKLFTTDMNSIINNLTSLKPILKTIDSGYNYLINNKIFKFNRFADKGLIFNPIPIYSYIDKDEEIYVSFIEMSRMSIPIIGKDILLILDDSVIKDDHIIDYTDDIEPIYKPINKFNESLLSKYNEIIKQNNNLNTLVSGGQVGYGDAIDIYRKSSNKLKDIKKDYIKVLKRLSTSVYGEDPVFVMYKFGIVYKLSKDIIIETIEVMSKNIQIAEDSINNVE